MNRLFALAAVLGLVLAACGGSEAPSASTHTTSPAPTHETPKGPPSDPNGKYKCLKCSTGSAPYRTSEKTCPRCGETLASDEPVKPTTAPSTDRPAKSAIAASYACGKASCRWTTPNKGSSCMDCDAKCEKEVWYVCAACKKESPTPGKCEGCQAEMKKELR